MFSPYSKAWALSGFGAPAWLPGSECALSPYAHAVLLNSQLPVQLPLFPAPCVIPAKWCPRVGHWLWPGDHRAVECCAARCLHLGRKRIGAEFYFLFYISAGAVTSLIALGSIVSRWVFLFSAKWHPRLRARVVKRLLCCCDYRVVLRCSAHPPRAGGQKTKLDPRGSGLGFAGRLKARGRVKG